MNHYLNNYPKSIPTAYVLLFFLGWAGAHRFYMKSYGLGVLYLCSLGLLGIGVVVDVFILGTKVHERNETVKHEELGRRAAMNGPSQDATPA